MGGGGGGGGGGEGRRQGDGEMGEYIVCMHACIIMVHACANWVRTLTVARVELLC